MVILRAIASDVMTMRQLGRVGEVYVTDHFTCDNRQYMIY